MGDFIETNTNKSALRELAAPVADITTFAGIIQSVLDDNPFGCTSYMVNGTTVEGIAKNRESYTARINYEDTDAKNVGLISIRAPDSASFETAATEVMGNATLAAAIGGNPVRDDAHDRFSCQLKCHDAGGEIYYVTFSRTGVRITSYEDDAIRTLVEIWADTVPALA